MKFLLVYDTGVNSDLRCVLSWLSCSIGRGASILCFCWFLVVVLHTQPMTFLVTSSTQNSLRCHFMVIKKCAVVSKEWCHLKYHTSAIFYSGVRIAAFLALPIYWNYGSFSNSLKRRYGDEARSMHCSWARLVLNSVLNLKLIVRLSSQIQ